MNTFYLGIDLNLPQDIKIIKLKRKLGFSGLGLYLELKLKLAQSPSYELSMDDFPDLAYEFRLELKYIKDLVLDFDLFTVENNKFYCQDVKDKMANLEKKKEAGKKAGLASGEARKNKKGTVVKQSFERSLNNKGDIYNKEINNINKKDIQKNAKIILETFNQTFNKDLKSNHSWIKNLEYWLQTYSLDEILKVIPKLNHPSWWAKDKPSLELLFRLKNKNGDCNYIQQLLDLPEIGLVEIPQQQTHIVKRSEYPKQQDLGIHLAYLAEEFPKLKIVIED